MSKPLGGRTIAQRLKSGQSLGAIIKDYDDNNSKNASQKQDDLWFHQRLTRGNAVHNLKKCGHTQGAFLVRESVNIPGSYVLSLIHNGDTQHFQINTSPHSGCFSIDNGPPFVGLDQLIKFYRTGANGLPTALTRNSPGYPLSPWLQQYGVNTIVHQAVDEAIDTSLFRQLLVQQTCPNVNIRNLSGRTALHEAAARGLNDLIFELFNRGADVKTRDADGNSPLHLACRGNHADTCKILVKHCHAKPQDRCCGTGWVPLHEAGYGGYHQCIDMLLKHGAACYPRCLNGDTPLDLARKRHHRQCMQLFEKYKPPSPHFNRSHYLHSSADRYKAVELLEHAGLKDGCFLVRLSKRNPGEHVLTMSFKETVFNYEIKNKNNWFYIDDGPLFSSLEYLIDYYCRCSDGLPAELHSPIPPFSRNQLPPVPKPLPVKPRENERPPAPVPQPHKPKNHYPPQPTHIPGLTPTNPQGQLEDIDPKSIVLGRELGQGEFGSVLMGVWANPSGKKVPVALKTLHGEHINTGEVEFQREAEVMMGLDHLCIVKLYGICRGETMMMVQELVAMGSALDYILDYPMAVQLADFKLWGAQIASGMNYLEGKGFVHRDLALRNILLASKQLVKISDFGLSRAVGAGSNYYKASAGGRWPVKWYAPESINYGTFASSSDVWSYGVTLWEIFSKGEQPYGSMTGAQVIQYIEDDKRRLARPEGCPEKVYEIMLKCWAYNPEERPTFKRLHSKFRSDPDYFNMQVPGHRENNFDS